MNGGISVGLTNNKLNMATILGKPGGLMPLQPLNASNQSPLFRRRTNTNPKLSDHGKKIDETGNAAFQNLGIAQNHLDVRTEDTICSRCNEGFGPTEKILNSGGEIWHTRCFVSAQCTHCHIDIDASTEEMVNYQGQNWHVKCFVCAQCFQPFPEGVFYEFDGRKYCEHDFHVLFAPCCNKCGQFVVGRVIKAMNASWHPDCFRCQLCNEALADIGFVKNIGRALCRECNAKEKASGSGKYVCHKCHSIIEEGHLRYKGDVYHPYHFSCSSCSVELTADAREKGGELLCLRCHDKTGIPICGACRRPIEERVVNALGKTWHVEHFVCAKCEKPFHGSRHYEKRGLAYCEIHYHQLFGDLCFACNNVISGDTFRALNKCWCVDHFNCSLCDRKLTQKNKFFELDLRPACKHCFEKFPAELKRRLKKAYDAQHTS